MLVLFFYILIFMSSFNKTFKCVQGGRPCGRMGDPISALKGPNVERKKERKGGAGIS